MRRIVAVLVLLAGAAVAAPSPAGAGGTTTTIVSKSKLPAGIETVRENCLPSPPNPPALSPTTSAYHHVFGASYPPLPKGSLRIDPTAGKEPGLRITSTGLLSNLTALRAQTDTDVGHLVVHVFVHSGTDDWVLSSASSSFVSGWADHNNLQNLFYSWTDVTSPATDSGTIAQFVLAHVPSTGFKVELISGDCSVSSTLPTYFDDVEIGLSGSTTRYDFEGPPGLTIKANHNTIVRGGSVTLSTVFTDGGVPVPGRHVGLWAKKQGATSFVEIHVVYPTPADGHGSFTAKPTKTTTYQWRYRGGLGIQKTWSHTKTVQVTP